jgi:hypothetical protein
MYQAIRNRLIGNASLAAMVSTNAITATKGRLGATYPCIRFRVVAANGNNLDSFLGGDLYLNIYTEHNNPAAFLGSVYNVLRPLIHDKGSAITTSNIGVGFIREMYVDYPQYEEEPGLYYLGARYSFTAQNKT